MSQYVLVLNFHRPPMTTNQARRAHFHTINKARNLVISQMFWALKIAKVPVELQTPLLVEVIWYPKINGRRDNDSLAEFLKAAKDALTRHGYIPDDASKYIVQDRMWIGEPNKEHPHIEVRLTEISDGDIARLREPFEATP